MATDSEVGELIEWLERLHKDVRQLRLHLFVWDEIQDIVSDNPDLHKPSHFFTWMQDMYVAGMATGIRRQIDNDRRTISLLRFLERIKADRSVVSRDRYAALYETDLHTAGDPRERELIRLSIDDTYDRFVGRGKDEPSELDINRQIGRLKAVSKRFVAFANMVIAHNDMNRPSKLPTFGDIDVVIRYFEELIRHYFQLFKAMHVSMDVNFVYDWKVVFRVPWIRSGDVESRGRAAHEQR